MTKTIFVAITLLAMSVLSQADVCPSITPMANFMVSKYLGKWYEQRQLPFVFTEYLSCVTAEYTPNDANSIKVKNSGVFRLASKSKNSEKPKQIYFECSFEI